MKRDRQRTNGTTSERFENSISDGTCFILNLLFERSHAGWHFEGIDSHGQNIVIQFHGRLPTNGDNDTYYNVRTGPVSKMNSRRTPEHPWPLSDRCVARCIVTSSFPRP
jgi:hypothetical protein